MSRFTLGFTAFELPSELKSEFLVLPYGSHETVDGQVKFQFAAEDAVRVMANFKARGIEMLNDWEHQSIAHLPGFEQFKAPDGRAPAAGWNGDLEARTDGLWATKVRWTPEAITALKSGAYRYFSPVLVFGADGRVKAIQSVGLTNEPRLKNIPALAARCDLGEFFASLSEGGIMPLKEQLAGALALLASASDQDIVNAVEALKTKATAGDTAAGQVTAFKTQADAAKVKETELASQITKLTAEKTALAADKTKVEGELTALKTSGEADKKALAETVLLFATETGRIAPAAKDAFKVLIDQNPAGQLAAFKATPAGSAVPTGRVTGDGAANAGGGNNGADLVGARGGDDHIAACKASAGFDPARLKIHEDALVLQRTNKGLSYPDAVSRVMAGGGAKK